MGLGVDGSFREAEGYTTTQEFRLRPVIYSILLNK